MPLFMVSMLVFVTGFIGVDIPFSFILGLRLSTAQVYLLLLSYYLFASNALLIRPSQQLKVWLENRHQTQPWQVRAAGLPAWSFSLTFFLILTVFSTIVVSILGFHLGYFLSLNLGCLFFRDASILLILRECVPRTKFRVASVLVLAMLYLLMPAIFHAVPNLREAVFVVFWPADRLSSLTGAFSGAALAVYFAYTVIRGAMSKSDTKLADPNNTVPQITPSPNNTVPED